MSKAVRYIVPGVHGEIEVRLVSRQTIRRKLKDAKKGEVYNGLYENVDHIIFIAKELHGSARVTVLDHEIAHHVLEACESIGEEEQCDLIGGYYRRLYQSSEFQGCIEEIGRA